MIIFHILLPVLYVFTYKLQNIEEKQPVLVYMLREKPIKGYDNL